MPALHAMNAYAPPEAIPESSKRPGDEPLPGYRLLEPLGRGGFGEVWKCEAPGGLMKAIKFVASDEVGHSLRQEYDAFQAIKAIRHPFLLQLERVELTSRELIMVMELADSQLQIRFMECRNAGLPGIPRDELLGYLADAAEALDVISTRHGLQHLDVKPANLFIVCGRVKVGDYGLVRAETTQANVNNRGFTPRYVAPEVLKGRVDQRSDQYSLALVYQELLTGEFAYNARTAQQMMMAHASLAPDLSGLPVEDVPAVSMALAKQPEMRYPSCLAFVQALMMAAPQRHDTMRPHDTATISAVRLNRVQTASGFLSRPNLTSQSSARMSTTRAPQPYAAPPPQFGSGPTPLPPQFGVPPLTTPAARHSSTRPFQPAPQPPRPAVESFPSAPVAPFGTTTRTARSIVPDEPVDLISAPKSSRVRLDDGLLKSVLPTAVLTGQSVTLAVATGDWFVNAMMTAALGDTDAIGRNPNGTWTFRFRSTHPVSVARQKLEALRTPEYFDDIIDRDATQVVLRRYAAQGLLGRFGGGKKSGFEVEVTWHGGRTGEIQLLAKLFGDPDVKFSRATGDVMPRLFNEIRSLLKAGDERRKDPRIPVDLDVNIYPLKDDGELLVPMVAKCRDVSSSGVALSSVLPIPTRYVYVEFPDMSEINGLAVLTKMIRSQPSGHEHLFAGRFRLDLL